MKIMGTVREVCAKQEGQSASGVFWEKQQLVINTKAGERDDIPVAITFFGERRTKWLKDLQPGQLIEVAFAMESRSFDGKWYTDVQGFGIIPYERMKMKDGAPAANAEPPAVNAETPAADASAPAPAAQPPVMMPVEQMLDF